MSREWKGSPSYGDVVVIVSIVVNVGVSIAFVTSVAFNNGTWRLGNYRVIVVVFVVIVFVIVVFIVIVFVSVVISIVVAFVVGETVASAATA